jgi:tRNA dimethylallyltransferase
LTPNSKDIPVIILFGPTASGKTDILLNIFSGEMTAQAEVISADSMQVYRGMDIGTAKPSLYERSLLPHHLIDICNPDEQYNAGDFVHRADKACIDIHERGKIPVISGGTGFYIKNFILGLPEAPPSDYKIRLQLKKDLQENGAAALMEELAAGDPLSAERIHLNDEYRLLRALEVLRQCGRPLSSFSISTMENRPRYRFLITGISRPRNELYERINRRCETMFKNGLEAEVTGLYEKGYTPEDPGLHAIGYREFFVEDPAAENKKWQLSKDTAGVQALIAQNSRRYAKRQITFFASIPDVVWIEGGKTEQETTELIMLEFKRFFP